MVTALDRTELQRLIHEEDLQVVDVLPEREYSESHIPGAINLPLKTINGNTASMLNRDKPVAVY